MAAEHGMRRALSRGVDRVHGARPHSLKFAAQCIACNHEPSTALEEMRRWLAKYFMPEWRDWFVDLPVHLQRLGHASPKSSRISPLTRP